MTLDLARIAHDANEASKFVRDSLGTRVLELDVPALIAEIEQLRAEAGGGWVERGELLATLATLRTERDAYRALANAADAAARAAAEESLL